MLIDLKKYNILEKIKSGSLSHAITIAGDDNDTKNEIIQKISEYFTCKSAEKPCGHCNICKKTIGCINPDIYILDNAEKIISVDDIRKIRKDSYIPPNECDKKVYIIKNGQNMNINAGNAFLKVLEEPPSYVSFIIEIPDENVLLDTILSRCVVYRFNMQNQVFDDKIVENAVKMMSFIDSEIDLLSIDYKKITKNEFLDIITVIKVILKDSILFEFNSDYVPLNDVSKQIFLNKSFNEITKIYDVCCYITEKCEYNISVSNLAYYFITEINK